VTIPQAKTILLAWRPGHGDLRDPQVAEALELARHQPALHVWLEKHRDFQRAMEKSLRETPIPKDLRAQVLSRMRAVQPMPWWRSPSAWAAAAGIVLLLGLAALWFTPPRVNSYHTFRDRTIRGVQRVYPPMEIVTNDMQQVRQFLGARKAPADYTLPPGLARLPVMGGGTLLWQGKAVSMVCLNSGQQGTLFLFVLDAATVRNPPSDTLSSPEFVPVYQMMTASWIENGKVYLLAGHGGMEALHRFL
jgi:uncharacterized membrane protein YbaN (DUF454 family)